MTALRLGVLAWPVGRPGDVAGYARRLDGFVAEAVGQADMLVMPEYACVELAAGAEGEAGELRAMVAEAPAVLEAMRGVARRHGVWLLPGSLPMAGADGRVVNRAPLIAPAVSIVAVVALVVDVRRPLWLAVLVVLKMICRLWRWIVSACPRIETAG